MSSSVPSPRFYVYALARPDGRVFYIGKGTGDRVQQHDREARSGHRCQKCNIIRKIWRNGGQVQRYFIFNTDDEQEAFAYEREQIALYGRKNLCNRTDGGEGAVGMVLSQSEVKRRKAFLTDPDVRAKAIAGMKAYYAANGGKHPRPRAKFTPEGETNRIAGMKAYLATPEGKAQRSATARAVMARAGVREHLRETSRAGYARRPVQQMVCVRCGKDYTTTSLIGSRFCSVACHSQHNRYLPENQEDRVCLHCGATFRIYKNDRARCCSKLCGNRRRFGKPGRG